MMIKWLIEKYKKWTSSDFVFPESIPYNESNDPLINWFVFEMSKDVDEWFCRTRNIPMTPEEYKAMLPEIGEHLRKYMPPTHAWLKSSWTLWHSANSSNILKNGLPVKRD